MKSIHRGGIREKEGGSTYTFVTSADSRIFAVGARSPARTRPLRYVSIAICRQRS